MSEQQVEAQQQTAAAPNAAMMAETEQEAQLAQAQMFTAAGPKPAVAGAPAARSGPSASEMAYDHKAPVGDQFSYKVGGPKPVAVGTKMQQLKQAAGTAELGTEGALAIASGNRFPTDRTAAAQLKTMHTNAPLPGFPLATTDYTSKVAGVPPEQVYAYFVAHPDKVFASAGLGVRGFAGPLVDGARIMLQDKGPPPVWAPIEVRLDPQQHMVKITTMDGHPLRGANNFKFDSDGAGGTVVSQHSEFQGSSPLVEIGKATGAIDHQHKIWEHVHQELFAHAAGEGAGTVAAATAVAAAEPKANKKQ